MSALYKPANPKKVLHIITRLIRGGADENTVISCLGLAERGWDVVLAVGKEHSHDLGSLMDRGIKMVVIKNLKRKISPIHDILTLCSFYRLCREHKPAIVHTHTAKAGLLGRVGARLAGVPCIVHSLHGSPVDSLKNPLMRGALSKAERWTCRFNDFYISVGKDILEKYCRQIGTSIGNYRIVRSAFDVARFLHSSRYRKEQRLKLGLEPGDLAVAVVGRLAPQKGYEYYAQLCKKLSCSSRLFKFFAMGKIDDERYFKKMQLEFAPVKDRMCFLGEVPYAELPRYIAAMDIIVHTALWEGLPRSVVEALISRKPVITFAVDGVGEVIDNGRNGYIVPMGDVEMMQERILHLVTEVGLDRFQAGAGWAHKRLAREFQISPMIDGIEESYFQAAGRMFPVREGGATFEAWEEEKATR